MPPNFKQKRVFLDTEVFVSEGFNFSSKKLGEIRTLASTGSISLLIPTTTVKECKQRIEKMMRAAKNLLKDKHNRFTLGILQQTTLDCAFLKDIDIAALATEVQDKFDKYLSDCNTEFVSAKEISAETVLDAYFANQPPFGLDQKKDQFPDAVAVLSLTQRLSKDNISIHVVSNDTDLTSACKLNPRLVVHKNLTEFLDCYNNETQQQSQFVHEKLTQAEDNIKRIIAEKFSWLGFSLSGQDGDVEQVVVNDVELGTSSILAIHEEHADVELEANINFTADVSYEDTDTGWWDSEDQIYYGMDTVSESVDRTEKVSLQVGLSWDEDGKTDIEVTLGLKDVDIDLDDQYGRHR